LRGFEWRLEIGTHSGALTATPRAIRAVPQWVRLTAEIKGRPALAVVALAEKKPMLARVQAYALRSGSAQHCIFP
jgi:hypothetical protein